VHSYTGRDNIENYCIECTWWICFTNSSTINNVQHKVLKYLHSPLPSVYYYGVVNLLSTYAIIIQIKFGMQSALSKFKRYFSLSIHKTCQAQWNFFLFWMDCIYVRIYQERNISLWCILKSCDWPYPRQEIFDTGIAWWVANSTSPTWPKTYYSNQCEGGTVSDHQRTTTVSLKHYTKEVHF